MSTHLTRALLDRFEAKFIPEPNSGCWLWLAFCNEDGYGTFRFADEGPITAHRASWKLYRGPIPEGQCALHKCDTRPCVNPDHLFLGTRVDNIADMDAKGRRRPSHSGGESTPTAVLTEDQVRLIRTTKGHAPQLAADLGVTVWTIYDIRAGRSWRNVA